jgi:hypothetical protein
MTSKHLRRLVHRLNRHLASAIADAAAHLATVLHLRHGRRHLRLAHIPRRPRR